MAALVIGTFLGVIWLTDAPVIGEVPTGLPELVTADLSTGTLLRAIQPALVIALVGSVDSLLTSLVADSIAHTRHNADRELLGQGIGNVVTGFIGKLPGSGATPGTVANIRAGGWTPLSGVLCVAILLALVVEQMVNTARDEVTAFIVMGLDGLPATALRALNILQNIPEDNFADNLYEAREIARGTLNTRAEAAA